MDGRQLKSFRWPNVWLYTTFYEAAEYQHSKKQNTVKLRLLNFTWKGVRKKKLKEKTDKGECSQTKKGLLMNGWKFNTKGDCVFSSNPFAFLIGHM